MKNLKKLPAEQLEKFSTIFTQLGLVLVLFIVYLALEHQTEEKNVAILKNDYVNTIYIEPTQNIIFKKEPEKRVAQKVQKIQKFIPDKVVKGNNDIIEKVVDITTLDDIVTVDVNDIVEVKIDEEIEENVDFINIESAPIFKGCEGLSKEENKICFEKKIKQFVIRNFDHYLANDLGLREGVHKIHTQFIIDKTGNVVDVKIRAPHKKLEEEAQRLINLLPKFTPGKQREKPVKVRYTLPISFNVQ